MISKIIFLVFNFQNFSQIKLHVVLIVDEYILYYNVN